MSVGSFASLFKSVTFINLLDHICMSFQDKQLKSDSSKNVETNILAKHKKKEREAAKQGKRPFYLKKCNFSLLSTILCLFFSIFHMLDTQSMLMLILSSLSEL